MKLSIRTKILSGYIFVIALFLSIVLNITFTQKNIVSRLKIVNEEYLPKLNMVNNLSNYSHLDESFDMLKIEQSIKNPILLQNIKTLHPRLFENQLTLVKQSIEVSKENVSNPVEKRFLGLILESTDGLKKKHEEYVALIQEAVSAVAKGKGNDQKDLNLSLLKKKSELKSEISLLLRRFYNTIRTGLNEVSKMQKRASIITGVLSLLAIIFAGGITLFALFTLAPIKKLIEGVKRISLGDYEYKLHIKSEGEIKSLADEFNNMSTSLLERDLALKEQQKKLIQSERMAVVGRMASHITHEIKNPLNSMSLNSELLEDELLAFKDIGKTDEAFSLIRSIRKEIERLSKISEEYLGYSRLPKGVKNLCSINSVISELTALLKVEINKSNITLEEDYDRNVPETMIDVNQMKQALLNIIKNSMEAIEGGGKIKIKTSFENNRITISIEDSGKGIPHDIIEHIFDPFFSTKAKGTGLGLPLTQKIITEQGGEIAVASSKERGTSFTIYLPVVSKEKALSSHV